MDRGELMNGLAERAFAARTTIAKVCDQAGVSRTIAYRWLHNPDSIPRIETIAKLEAAMADIEEAKA